MLAHLKHFGRRFVLMLGGEVLQSAFHFAFNIVLVHLLSAWEYGLFAIVMLIGGLALTYTRSLAGMPATLLIPAHRNRPRAAVFAVNFASGALGIGVLTGLGVAAGLEPWIGSGALLAGTFVGLWSIRSFLRTALYAFQRQVQSTISDAAYIGSGVVLSLILIRGQTENVLDRVFLVLALANAIAIAVALVLPREPIRVSFGASTRRRYRRMGSQLGWACAGVTTSNIQAQGQVALIAVLAGPAAYAPIAAVLVFFAPLRLIASALANMMQPELTRHAAAGDREKIRTLLLVWTGAMLAVGLAYGGAVMLALPFIDTPVFAGQPKMLIGLLAWVVNIAMLLYVMPKILLEVLRAFRMLAVMATVSAMVGMSLVVMLIMVFGPTWSLIGSVVSELVVLVWCWLAVRMHAAASGAKPPKSHPDAFPDSSPIGIT